MRRRRTISLGSSIEVRCLPGSFGSRYQRGHTEKQRLRIPLLDKNSSSLSTDRLALTFWTRSAAQDNVDALVKMGDYYLNGVGVAAGRPQPEKAAACYQSAASTHVSALAMHNLGWMHENGVGVTKVRFYLRPSSECSVQSFAQDYHLAKRYYDLAFETSNDAYFPVFLSLVKLHCRSLYDALTGGGISSLSFFDSPLAPGGVGSAEEAAEEHARQLEEGAERLKRDIKQSWWLKRFFGGDEQANPQARQQVAGAAGQPQNAQNALAEAQRALQGDDDPVRWAREAQAREQEAAEMEAEGFGPGDYFDAEGPNGARFGVTGLDEGTETILLVGLCVFIAYVSLRASRAELMRTQMARLCTAGEAEGGESGAEAKGKTCSTCSGSGSEMTTLIVTTTVYTRWRARKSRSASTFIVHTTTEVQFCWGGLRSPVVSRSSEGAYTDIIAPFDALQTSSMRLPLSILYSIASCCPQHSSLCPPLRSLIAGVASLVASKPCCAVRIELKRSKLPSTRAR